MQKKAVQCVLGMSKTKTVLISSSSAADQQHSRQCTLVLEGGGTTTLHTGIVLVLPVLPPHTVHLSQSCGETSLWKLFFHFPLYVIAKFLLTQLLSLLFQFVFGLNINFLSSFPLFMIEKQKL